jgi:hypothetical protein
MLGRCGPSRTSLCCSPGLDFLKQQLPGGGIGHASWDFVLEGSEHTHYRAESEILTLGEEGALFVSEILKPPFEDGTKDVRARGTLGKGYSRCLKARLEFWASHACESVTETVRELDLWHIGIGLGPHLPNGLRLSCGLRVPQTR